MVQEYVPIISINLILLLMHIRLDTNSSSCVNTYQHNDELIMTYGAVALRYALILKAQIS